MKVNFIKDFSQGEDLIADIIKSDKRFTHDQIFDEYMGKVINFQDNIYIAETFAMIHQAYLNLISEDFE